jgi:dTDP-glucose pyrophosphorylase
MTDIWRKVVVSERHTIRHTIECIDRSSLQIALVVSPSGRLLGTVTDGDVRRGILKGIQLDEPVNLVMNQTPHTIGSGLEREAVLSLMRQTQVRQMPVVDSSGVLVGLEVLDEILVTARHDRMAVLMAGGTGSRLRDLTKDCPKPMLEVGGRAILETILLSLIEFGFHRFYFAVNYKAGVIQRHFGDGSRWNVDIQYVCETERMGTAGALSLLPEMPTEPFLVMNGDLLTKVNVESLFNFHQAHDSVATMCVREYDLQVPYGVLKLDNHRVIQLEEKPVQRFFVNAGVYVLQPEILPFIPRNQFYDMTALFERLILEGKSPAAFPIREYWLDVGRPADFERAAGEFEDVFE